MTGLPWQSRVITNPLTAPQLDDDLEYLLGVLEFPVSTVADLPASPAQGDGAFVTDATSSTFAGNLTGGGTISTPVYYNGAAWKVG
jgi:hypothetical protein